MSIFDPKWPIALEAVLSEQKVLKGRAFVLCPPCEAMLLPHYGYQLCSVAVTHYEWVFLA